MRQNQALLIRRLRDRDASVPHRALMDLRTARKMLAEILDARPSEVDAILRERVAERFSVLEWDDMD